MNDIARHQFTGRYILPFPVAQYQRTRCQASFQQIDSILRFPFLEEPYTGVDEQEDQDNPEIFPVGEVSIIQGIGPQK
jgi:hypothetical protein